MVARSEREVVPKIDKQRWEYSKLKLGIFTESKEHLRFVYCAGKNIDFDE